MNTEQKKTLNLLKTARGQLNKTIDMLEDGRYCVAISTQILATQGLLKKSNLLILEQHMHHCVLDAFQSGDGNGEEKIAEIIDLLGAYTK